MFLISPFAYSDMDKVCLVLPLKPSLESMFDDIKKEIKLSDCKRNNILRVRLYKPEFDPEIALANVASKYCRFDRNIVIKGEVMTCVLYWPEARTLKEDN